MYYLTLNLHKEVIERMKMINSIKQNRIDAVAELEEVKKRNPLIRTKSASESKHGGSSEKHSIAVILDAKQKALEKQIAEYDSIIYSYEKGYRLLNEQEKEVLKLRYHEDLSQQQTADAMDFSLSHIKQVNASLIDKMIKQLLS